MMKSPLILVAAFITTALAKGVARVDLQHNPLTPSILTADRGRLEARSGKGTGSLRLANLQNVQYTTNATVGTGTPQLLAVYLDTGSDSCANLPCVAH
jgi:hypothetical protein